MRELLRLTSGSDPSAVWLATTDADTAVPPGWLRRQLEYADAGWDVVLGTVTVTDWGGHPPHVPVAFEERYAFGSAARCADQYPPAVRHRGDGGVRRLRRSLGTAIQVFGYVMIAISLVGLTALLTEHRRRCRIPVTPAG